MLKKTLTIVIAVVWVGALVAAPVQAGNGKQQKSANNTPSAQVQKEVRKGVCPYGNALGARHGVGRACGYGPGDGTGKDGDGPKDGTGYGVTKQGIGTNANPNCDGTGPKGAVKRNGQPG